FFADFACREANLIVEVDGGQHSESRHDVRRTAELETYGYRVIRFWNHDILDNIEGVFTKLAGELEKAPSPARFAVDLSPKGRGEGGCDLGGSRSQVPSPLGEKDRMRGP